MKSLLYLSIIVSLVSCRNDDYSAQLRRISYNVESGNLDYAIRSADSLKNISLKNISVSLKADSLLQIAERLKLEYSIPEDETFARIEKRLGPVSPEEKAEWERNGWLESRMINGKRMYFNRASSNLILLRKFHEEKGKRDDEIASESNMIFRRVHTEAILKASDGKPVEPVSMKITYTISVHKDAVPEGEVIRCWIPWPQENHGRQKNVKLIHTSEPEYIIAPDTAVHSTIYMEAKAVKGTPSVFSVSFNYESCGQHFDPPSMKILPYDKNSSLYRKYTSEQLPHINFSPEIKRLADSISGEGDNPYETVRKIYFWFKDNIPWTGAPEYSIIPDIPAYVIQNKRGDCGIQSFLFISMLRYKGIPVRWQSGWMVPPGAENLHDWCEVYYEGTGWVPVDISYDLQKSETNSVREFYLSGIDSYRLIINDGIAGRLHPEKYFLRSEPYDFQRGEVEWKGGNLYFDKWDYDMKIEYLNK